MDIFQNVATLCDSLQSTMIKGLQIDDKEYIYFKHSPKFETQAERVLRKFGGVHRFVETAESLGFEATTPNVYRWLRFGKPRAYHGKSKSYGMIPLGAWPMILEMARLTGLVLTPEDVDPRPVPRDGNWVEKRVGGAYLRGED